MNSLYRIAPAAALAALLSQPVPAAAETRFTILPRVDPSAEADLNLTRWLNFEADVSLKVRTDPALVPSARVIELVEAIPMISDAGVKITRGYDIDTAHDLVVAMAGGTAEIIRVRETSRGLEVAALFKDDQGQIILPPQSSLAAYTTGGDRLCFEQAELEKPVETPAPMAFVLLLDRSGSMAPVMPEVQAAAQSFIEALPDTARCTVAAFSETISLDPAAGLGSGQCRAENFALGQLSVGGNTDLYSPLAWAYDMLKTPSLRDHQKAVVVLTDGAANLNLDLARNVTALKGDALTFVYFLGAREERFLQHIADNYLEHRGDLASQLGRYFEVISTAYRKQTVLRLKSCTAADAKTGSAHGTP